MLWEGDDFEWVSKDANGRSGGLIVIWKKGSFEMLVEFSSANFMGIEGWWEKEKIKCRW